jgi:metal transporter CNNM
MPVLQKHHWLLCTLLIGNALCVETLPIFIESTLPGFLAIIISTIVVVVVCEIIP